MPRPALRLN
ncbi:hypothetical protein Patl1_33147 [Pistacia atlantica]|uniref:Uncharacterized protein n=2 Tax=Pistacia atlantica TaxID=434234 RepID=A0ACC1ARJ7_9ROSI|nr:hypothetical protein Patl1_33120 [Pistacia atlantica]KAJ0089287.1 hypothetical protein Patl1_33147 [Pistacia atlantica]